MFPKIKRLLNVRGQRSEARTQISELKKSRVTDHESRVTNHGFTLLEMITASLITMVMVYMLYVMFNQTMKVISRNERDTEIFENVRVIFDTMSREFSGAYLDLDSSQTCNYVGDLWNNHSRCRFFSLTNYDYDEGATLTQTALAKVSYRIDADGADTAVYRSFESNQNPSATFYDLNSITTPVDLGTNVLEIKLRYWKGDFVDNDKDLITDNEDDTYDTREWATTWNAADASLRRLPQMIYIELDMKGASTNKSRKFATIIKRF